jgi:GMP synthase-like glutamine amidotransferase
VQFHPESILTEHGHAMLANFLTAGGVAVDAGALKAHAAASAGAQHR